MSSILIVQDFQSNDITYPQVDGLDTQVLQTNGMGSLSFDFPSTITCISGTFRNVASAGSGLVFASWGGNNQANRTNPLLIPYPCSIIGYGISYSDTVAINIPVGDSITFDLGLPNLTLARTNANYNAVVGTQIVWNNSLTGSYPSSSITGINIPVPINTLVAARASEMGDVLPSSAEVTITLWLRGKFI